MIYRWTTKTPTEGGLYWAMFGGCEPVLVNVDYERLPSNAEQAETEPFVCRWIGQYGDPPVLSDKIAICWCGPINLPVVPTVYWGEWRNKKPTVVETAEAKS